MQRPFELHLRTRLVFGADRVESAGEVVGGELEADRGRILIVTDPGVAAAGHAERLSAVLQAAGFEALVFDRVRENPTSEDVELCLGALADADPDLVIGLGGGSPIDVAKGALLVHAGGGRMADYRGRGKARGRLLPLIAVPTTAGTGTEVQSFALIADPQTHQKMACGDPQVAPRVAILDPTLTTTLPRFVTACTGLDAIGHAVETAVTRVRNPLSAVFSREAWRLASAALPRVLEAPEDLAARGDMLLAAAYAGLAIEQSMLGAAHSMANPLTARLGYPHGQAVGLALPHVVRFNAADDAAGATYAELSRVAGGPQRAEALVERLQALLELCALPAPGEVAAPDVSDLAAEAAGQWTAGFNPRQVTAEGFVGLFEAVLPNR